MNIANNEFSRMKMCWFFSLMPGKKLKSYRKTYLHIIDFAGAMSIHTI